MNALRFTISEVQLSTRPVHFRLPFHFGNTVVTQTDEAHISVVIHIGDRRVAGKAAQLMVPRWFDKRADRSNDDTVADLKASCENAVRLAPQVDEDTLAATTTHLRAETEAAMPMGTPRLAAHFGPSLIEMALIDALCFAANLNFAQAARQDIFGVATLAADDIPAHAISRALAAIAPIPAIAPRQTVGFDAPLYAGELDPSHPLDGKPVSLEDIIRETGTRAFKIKLKGDPDADIDRLCRIAGLVGGMDGLKVTLDANEQYRPARFAQFTDALMTSGALNAFRQSIAFIEQPFAREEALDIAVTPELSAFPLIIDESDDHDSAFATAISHGWTGTSIKSCKGILRALLNFARVHHHQAEGRKLFISAEDLTCQPGLCWQQDTAVAAALGCRDVERNGHHFGGGLQGYDDLEKARILAAHPDIYKRENSDIRLAIEDGSIAIGSLFRPGLGR